MNTKPAEPNAALDHAAQQAAQALAQAEAAAGSASQALSLASSLEKNLNALLHVAEKSDKERSDQLSAAVAEVRALAKTVARHDKHLAPTKESQGVPRIMHQIIDGITDAMVGEAKAADKSLDTLRNEFRDIAAQFSTTLKTMQALNGNHVTAAAHRLQSEARFLATNTRGKSNGATASKSIIDNSLIGESK